MKAKFNKGDIVRYVGNFGNLGTLTLQRNRPYTVEGTIYGDGYVFIGLAEQPHVGFEQSKFELYVSKKDKEKENAELWDLMAE